MRRIVLAVLMAAVPAIAGAAEIRVLPARSGLPVLAVSGTLVPGDADRLRAVATGVGRAMLVLSLGEGDMAEAALTGGVAHELGMATYVGAGADCGAACGLAWAGGRRRYLERGARVDLSGLSGRTDLSAAWGITPPVGTGAVDAEGARAAGVRVLDAVADPSPAEARSISAAAERLRRTYRKDGMVGLSALVRSCYAKARGIAAVAGCRAADRLAADIDAKASEGLGFPGLPYFGRESVAGRLSRALDALKVPQGSRDDLAASWDAAAGRAFAESGAAD